MGGGAIFAALPMVCCIAPLLPLMGCKGSIGSGAILAIGLVGAGGNAAAMPCRFSIGARTNLACFFASAGGKSALMGFDVRRFGAEIASIPMVYTIAGLIPAMLRQITIRFAANPAACLRGAGGGAAAMRRSIFDIFAIGALIPMLLAIVL